MKQALLLSWDTVCKDVNSISRGIVSLGTIARQVNSVLIFNFGTLHTDPFTLLTFPDS